MTFWSKIDVLYRAYLDYMNTSDYLIHDEHRDTIVYSGKLLDCKRYLLNHANCSGVLKPASEVKTYLYGYTKTEYDRFLEIYDNLRKGDTKKKKKK